MPLALRFLLTLLFFAMFTNILLAQDFEYELFYDTEFNTGIGYSLEDHQQNIIFTGGTFDTAYHYSGFLLKLSPSFDTTVIVIENDTADIFLKDFVITHDNNYFVIGSIGRDTGYYYQSDHIVIYIFDENLNMITEKVYQMPEGNSYPKFFLWQAENGNVYAVGQRDTGYTELMFLKFDQNGNLLLGNYTNVWTHIYGILPKYDNISGLYAFGLLYGVNGMSRMEIDTNLNYSVLPMEGDEAYGSFFHDATGKWLNDTMFLFSSLVQTDTIGSDQYEDNILLKVNENLESTDEYITVGLPGTRDYGFPYNMDWKNPDQMYVATFDAYAPTGQYRYFVALFNENLDVLGTKTISGGEEIDYTLGEICATSDGGIICSGRSHATGSEDYDWDPFIHKITAENIVQVAEKTANPYDSDYLVYPNPGKDIINVQTARKGVVMEFYNDKGQLVMERQFCAGYLNTIDTEKLPPGKYIFELTDGEGFSETGKWLKID